ncbi:MAG: hypothetical protein NDI82_08150 [Anaeromyxobacteraceae bacterium]|nr:hypothetical protein [Anaeromyxobacteraceae bacterium]
MRWSSLSWSLLVLAACAEPSAVRTTPTDRLVGPSAVAVTTPASGGTALLVVSGNYDLTYDGANGGTLLSVDPADWDPVTGTGGSAGRPGGELLKYGEGAHVGSFTGELAVADAVTCPVKPGDPARAPEAIVPTRFADEVWRLPLSLEGEVSPCPAGCLVPTDPDLHDPFGATLACRPDGLRRSAFVGYLRTAAVAGVFEKGWVVEVDLDDPASANRSIQVGDAGLGGMAYDALTDRLYVLERRLLAAPIHILDLTTCPSGLAACPTPASARVTLDTAILGLDLQSMALSNPQPGVLGRRGYVSARVYDASLASLFQARPTNDIGAVLLVLDLEENASGRPAMTVLNVVPVGMGTGQVLVLPARPGLRDLVVVSGATDGVLTVYDDEQGVVARAITMDDETGAPEAGRGAYGLAMEPVTKADGAYARVYVAASQQAAVGVVEVPLARPGHAQVARMPSTGELRRIGGLQ